MKISRNRLIEYLKNKGIDMLSFIKELGWSYERFVNMLFANGSLNEEDAMKFIQHVGAKDALEIINWRAMNVNKPKYRDIFQFNNAYQRSAI
jgi:hypothetical protein